MRKREIRNSNEMSCKGIVRGITRFNCHTQRQAAVLQSGDLPRKRRAGEHGAIGCGFESQLRGNYFSPKSVYIDAIYAQRT